ncbi:hypothetical protein JX265_012567 [Neoarthrinium moseri]|uniref:Uncharacterized protein n=1 Tax=Neoarthrinium moseri TaxID=1658444 RepID=A0A9P9WA57_9PEZI|nr:hypothetical protein JX265_012567 [Neoarthrinium moseri]
MVEWCNSQPVTTACAQGNGRPALALRNVIQINRRPNAHGFLLPARRVLSTDTTSLPGGLAGSDDIRRRARCAPDTARRTAAEQARGPLDQRSESVPFCLSHEPNDDRQGTLRDKTNKNRDKETAVTQQQDFNPEPCATRPGAAPGVPTTAPHRIAVRTRARARVGSHARLQRPRPEGYAQLLDHL